MNHFYWCKVEGTFYKISLERSKTHASLRNSHCLESEWFINGFCGRKDVSSMEFNFNPRPVKVEILLGRVRALQNRSHRVGASLIQRTVVILTSRLALDLAFPEKSCAPSIPDDKIVSNLRFDVPRDPFFLFRSASLLYSLIDTWIRNTFTIATYTVG